MALKDDRYNASPKGRARSRRYRETGAHARNQRRYYYRGGSHTESARKVQRRIDRMTEELEALSHGSS